VNTVDLGSVVCEKILTFSSVSYILGKVLGRSPQTTETIQKFTHAFDSLRHSFDSAMAIQTAFISFRISQGIDKIGSNLFL
jgi:hypothetical protein